MARLNRRGAALEVEDLEVRYGLVRAVRGLSLRAERGSVVGLIGPNGAGKSTTLHAIMGIVTPRRAKCAWRPVDCRSAE